MDQTDTPPEPGYWKATDGRWYPPNTRADGWWLASDGNWYPPMQPPAQPIDHKARGKRMLGIVAVVVGGLLILGAIGAMFGSDDEPEAAAEPRPVEIDGQTLLWMQWTMEDLAEQSRQGDEAEGIEVCEEARTSGDRVLPAQIDDAEVSHVFTSDRDARLAVEAFWNVLDACVAGDWDQTGAAIDVVTAHLTEATD